VWVEKKHKELDVRALYSQQLREYLKKQGLQNRTCIVVANTKRAKLEKKFLKMKKLYTQSKDGKVHFDVKYLGNQDFEFKTIDMSGYYTPENTATEE
jgi:tRNA pseudouridine-54 N-methylase